MKQENLELVADHFAKERGKLQIAVDELENERGNLEIERRCASCTIFERRLLMTLRRRNHLGLKALGAGGALLGVALLWLMGPDLIRYARIKTM